MGMGHKSSINILVFLPTIFSLQRYSRGEKNGLFKHLSLRVDSGQEIYYYVWEHKTQGSLVQASETRKQSRSLALLLTCMTLCWIMLAHECTNCYQQAE